MSQLLSRVLKLLDCKNVIRHNNKMARLFSYMPMYPYALIDRILNGQVSSDGCFKRRMLANTEKEIVIMNEELAREIRYAMNIGYKYKPDRIEVCQSSDYLGISRVYYDPPCPNVLAKKVRLPYLPTGSQIQNAAMPSCQREEDLNNEDMVVVVKLVGSQLKVYRPAPKVDPYLQWTDIETRHEYMCPFSSLMFSKKDQKFYTPSPGGKYLCSFDLKFKKKNKPKLVRLWPKLLPLWNNWAGLFPLPMTDHLVESPSGEQFLIKWCYGDDMKDSSSVKCEHKTKRFLVFKVEKEPVGKGKELGYTENIGDLCIFLGRDEAFCLQASSSPGLKPNCIYFVGHNYGLFDITAQICTLFTTEEGPLRSTGFPYWPYPLLDQS